MDQIWRLKHFLAVAEAGSVQGAARSLNISQPALSKSLRQLEEHLQAALFDRSARGVVLTPMGQVFYRHAREIQSEWDSSVIEISAARDGAQGELRLWRHVGCTKCEGHGYHGRLGIHELMMSDETIRQHIRHRAPASDIRHSALAAGMLTLRQDGIEKVLQGLTDMSEVVAATNL